MKHSQEKADKEVLITGKRCSQGDCTVSLSFVGAHGCRGRRSRYFRNFTERRPVRPLPVLLVLFHDFIRFPLRHAPRFDLPVAKCLNRHKPRFFCRICA